MPSMKRAHQDLEDELTEHSALKLHKIRNMWQFANLCQWIYLFGKVAKINDSLDIEDIETECLKTKSTVLEDFALALLKLVSSHRGLTHDNIDAQARKQYITKSSGHNPFGAEDAPQRFADFDIFTKIKVLQQLTQWVMMHPERLRDHMEEQKDMEQTTWRIEPYGWDSQDRTYYVLDDNRVYRLSQSPANFTQRLIKMTSSNSGRRSSKRRRGLQAAKNSMDVENTGLTEFGKRNEHSEDDGLGGMTWECIAITLSEVQHLLGTMARTRDENEKILRKQLETHLVPILEKQEETRRRKEVQRERELLNQAKMANAKRSSRIANKLELQRLEEKARSERRLLEQQEAATQRQETRRQKLEQEQESRFFSRARRFREREVRRLCHEEKLSQLFGEQANIPVQAGRVSERRLQVEIDRTKQALEDLEQQEDFWTFDCLCGMHGQVYDGAHSISCERCNTWQHSECLGISKAVADQPDFHFICSSCSRQTDEEKRPPRTPIRIKLHVMTSSSDPHRPAGVNSLEGDPNTLLPLEAQLPHAAHADESQQQDKDLARAQELPKSHLSPRLVPSSIVQDTAASSRKEVPITTATV